MQRDVQVMVVGASLCAVVAYLLLGASKWFALALLLILLFWALLLALSRPKAVPAPQAPLPEIKTGDVKVGDFRSGDVRTGDIKVYLPTQAAEKQSKKEPALLLPRDEKSYIEQKSIKYAWLACDDRCTFGTSHDKTALIGVLLPFYNNPIKSKVAAEFVRAHLIFKDKASQREDLSLDAAFWVGEEYSYRKELRRGEQGEVIIAFYALPGMKLLAFQDNRSNYSVWEHDNFECVAHHQLEKKKYDVSIHLIWGGNDQFSTSYSVDLDLESPEKFVSSLLERG